MSDLISLTVLQRGRLYRFMYPSTKVNFVVDKDYKGEFPEVIKEPRVFDIICSPYQKFNMERRDDNEYWQNFYDQIDLPRSVPMEKKQPIDDKFFIELAKKLKAK